jgi:glycosyltransferase involved in cell wall biosynthesis
MLSPFHDEPISVVMPVHNALPYLDEAVRSILGQSYSNFEFVILDDASTDGTTQRLREWAARDRRIRLHEGERNLCPAASSNFVVEQARTGLIARMDADDVSHPDRLRDQVSLLRSRPDVGLVGSLCEILDGLGHVIRGPDGWRLDRESWFAPFPHGSIMYRREMFDRIGGYREQCVFWEDQDLFLRMARETGILTISRPLYQHRHSRISTRLVQDQDRVERAVNLMYRCLKRLDRGEPYEDLLRGGSPPPGDKRHPRVFIFLGSLQLWTGGKPRLFRRVLQHGRLRLNMASVTTLIWTLWASASPSTLRSFMRLLADFRNRLSGRALRDPAVQWKVPGRPPVGPGLGRGVREPQRLSRSPSKVPPA